METKKINFRDKVDEINKRFTSKIKKTSTLTLYKLKSDKSKRN